LALVIPKDYVPVPGSRLHHRSCVHHVPSGSVLTKNDDGSFLVQTPEAGSYRVAACKHKEIRLNGKSKQRKIRGGRMAALVAPQACEQWIVDTIQTLADPNGFDYMSSNFMVPNPPKSDPSTLLYTFPSLCDAASDDIIQPVLQWGSGPGGGGAEWIFESWYVGNAGSFHSDLLGPLTPQTPLFGFMQYYSSNQTWLTRSIVSGSGQHTDLSMTFADTQALPNAYIALEMYQENDCGNLPPENGIAYTDLVLKGWSGSAVPLAMTPDIIRCTDCNFNSTIDNDGNTVTLTWQSS